MRLAVVDDVSNTRSLAWTVALAPKGDIYVSMEGVNSMRCSLHPSGDWAWKIGQADARKIKLAELPIRARELAPGVERIAQIRVHPFHFGTRTRAPADTILVNVDGSESSTAVEVVITQQALTTGDQLHAAPVADSRLMRDGRTIAFCVHQTPIDVPDIDTASNDYESMQSGPIADALLVAQLGDGPLLLMECRPH
jgi:hypothetical protein